MFWRLYFFLQEEVSGIKNQDIRIYASICKQLCLGYISLPNL